MSSMAGSMTSMISGGRANSGGGRGGGVDYGGVAKAVGTGVTAARMGDDDEPAMGQSVAAVAIGRYRLVSDRKLTRYVSLVGLTLASSSPRPDGQWSFGVLDTDIVNAFSGPDGYVMITRGALSQMRDESELAGVLGHEMSHVLNHDGLEAARSAMQKQAIVEGASAASKQVAQFSQALDGTVDTVFNKGYARDQENKADAGAVQLVAAAGYDPNGYLHFIERLGTQQKQNGSTIFSTHPGLADRVSHIREEISRAGSPRGQTLPERFTASVK